LAEARRQKIESPVTAELNLGSGKRCFVEKWNPLFFQNKQHSTDD
jgi:hypothetical protein